MTPKAQRIGIIVIAVVMILGTLGSFAMFILANDNNARQQERASQELEELMAEQQRQSDELSAQYLESFKEYEDRPAAFDATAVGDEATYVDLKEGDGEVITADFRDYRAYYTGWNPAGTVFDSSLSGDRLSPPLDLSEMNLIPGWYSGVEGMKIGGVREITIPSDLAYGEAGGAGGEIPPNSPIKFIVMAIPPAE